MQTEKTLITRVPNTRRQIDEFITRVKSLGVHCFRTEDYKVLILEEDIIIQINLINNEVAYNRIENNQFSLFEVNNLDDMYAFIEGYFIRG